MSIWYEATRGWKGVGIVPVVVDKETEKFLTIDGRRVAKHSEWNNYFSTREEAKGYLLDVIGKKIKHCQQQQIALQEEMSAALEL